MLEMTSIDPVKPVAAYVGGKSRLARTIIPYIEAIPHKSYCEPFVGMGGIFFRRKFKPKTEVINDYNGEISNLFRILCYHYDPFIDLITWKLSSREEYGRLIDTKPETLTDLQRAVRFFLSSEAGFRRKD